MRFVERPSSPTIATAVPVWGKILAPGVEWYGTEPLPLAAHRVERRNHPLVLFLLEQHTPAPNGASRPDGARRGKDLCRPPTGERDTHDTRPLCADRFLKEHPSAITA